MRWYVIQVTTGKELDIKKQLSLKDMISCVPREDRLIRHNGRWINKIYILFPGYVFIYVNFAPDIFHEVNGISGVIRFLPNSEAQPVPDSELHDFIFLQNEVIQPSTLCLNSGKTVFKDGILKDLSHKVVKINHHSKKAKVKLCMFGKPKSISLSFKTEKE